MTRADDEAREALMAALVRVGEGERSALEDVFRATRVKLFGICLRILKDRKEAEDALQDVYLTVWRSAGRYDPDKASPITWLATLARNRAIDRMRTGKVRGGAVPVEAAAELADQGALAESLMIDAERESRVHTCLETLDDPQRSAIRTAFLDGVTYADLAEREGVPLGTMKSWIRRGLARLKTCMEGGE